MSPNVIRWLFSGVIACLVSLGTYAGVEILPAIASLEAKAVHCEQDTKDVAKSLEMIRRELNEVNVKLARIEEKL